METAIPRILQGAQPTDQPGGEDEPLLLGPVLGSGVLFQYFSITWQALLASLCPSGLVYGRGQGMLFLGTSNFFCFSGSGVALMSNFEQLLRGIWKPETNELLHMTL